jgi:hypothetical protein
MLSVEISIIDDDDIKGEQVSEETTYTERAQTNSGLMSRVNVLFGGARAGKMREGNELGLESR